jgi:hypothetical protein
MSDWQVGDLAVCVKPVANLQSGAIYRVVSVCCDGSGLNVDGGIPLPGTHAFSSGRFRKLRADQHEACKPEFVTLLKRSKRKVSA